MQSMIAAVVFLGLWLGSTESREIGNPQFIDLRVSSVELGSVPTGEAFVRRNGGREVEVDGGLPLYRYVNTPKTEVLELVMHPGGQRYEFMEFHIRRPSPAEVQVCPVAAVDSFLTGRGLHLGLTIDEVVSVLGAPQQQAGSGRSRGLHYRCTSPKTCPILEQVSMPEYHGRYFFADGKLVTVESGYAYP